jgi:hypothetical protein
MNGRTVDTTYQYYRAYSIARLRRFAGWAEVGAAYGTEPPEICYLRDDLRLVDEPFDDADVIVAEVSPEWRAFCREDLEFSVPDDLRGGPGTAGHEAGEAATR